MENLKKRIREMWNTHLTAKTAAPSVPQVPSPATLESDQETIPGTDEQAEPVVDVIVINDDEPPEVTALTPGPEPVAEIPLDPPLTPESPLPPPDSPEPSEIKLEPSPSQIMLTPLRDLSNHQIWMAAFGEEGTLCHGRVTSTDTLVDLEIQCLHSKFETRALQLLRQ